MGVIPVSATIRVFGRRLMRDTGCGDPGRRHRIEVIAPSERALRARAARRRVQLRRAFHWSRRITRSRLFPECGLGSEYLSTLSSSSPSVRPRCPTTFAVGRACRLLGLRPVRERPPPACCRITIPLTNCEESTGDQPRNSEGEYSGSGGRAHNVLPESDRVSIFTRTGVERIHRFAFARRRERARTSRSSRNRRTAARHVMWDESSTKSRRLSLVQDAARAGRAMNGSGVHPPCSTRSSRNCTRTSSLTSRRRWQEALGNRADGDLNPDAFRRVEPIQARLSTHRKGIATRSRRSGPIDDVRHSGKRGFGGLIKAVRSRDRETHRRRTSRRATTDVVTEPLRAL